MLAPVADERDDDDAAVLVSKRPERHLRRDARARAPSARERDRRAVPVPEDPADDVLKLWKLTGVDLRDRRREQRLERVPEHAARGCAGREEPVLGRVDHEGRIARAVESPGKA